MTIIQTGSCPQYDKIKNTKGRGNIVKFKKKIIEILQKYEMYKILCITLNLPQQIINKTILKKIRKKQLKEICNHYLLDFGTVESMRENILIYQNTLKISNIK